MSSSAKANSICTTSPSCPPRCSRAVRVHQERILVSFIFSLPAVDSGKATVEQVIRLCAYPCDTLTSVAVKRPVEIMLRAACSTCSILHSHSFQARLDSESGCPALCKHVAMQADREHPGNLHSLFGRRSRSRLRVTRAEALPQTAHV